MPLQTNQNARREKDSVASITKYYVVAIKVTIQFAQIHRMARGHRLSVAEKECQFMPPPTNKYLALFETQHLINSPYARTRHQLGGV